MPISILIVKDDIAVKTSTREFLELTGASVITASSAEEAFDLLNPFTPDIVLTDIINSTSLPQIKKQRSR